MFYIIVNGTSIIKTFDTLQKAKTSLTRKYIKKFPDARIVDNKEFTRLGESK